MSNSVCIASGSVRSYVFMHSTVSPPVPSNVTISARKLVLSIMQDFDPIALTITFNFLTNNIVKGREGTY